MVPGTGIAAGYTGGAWSFSGPGQAVEIKQKRRGRKDIRVNNRDQGRRDVVMRKSESAARIKSEEMWLGGSLGLQHGSRQKSCCCNEVWVGNSR